MNTFVSYLLCRLKRAVGLTKDNDLPTNRTVVALRRPIQKSILGVLRLLPTHQGDDVLECQFPILRQLQVEWPRPEDHDSLTWWYAGIIHCRQVVCWEECHHDLHFCAAHRKESGLLVRPMSIYFTEDGHSLVQEMRKLLG